MRFCGCGSLEGHVCGNETRYGSVTGRIVHIAHLAQQRFPSHHNVVVNRSACIHSDHVLSRISMPVLFRQANIILTFDLARSRLGN